MNAGITAIAEILSAEKWRIKRLFFKKEIHMSKQPKPYRLCPRCNTAMNGSKYDPSWVDEMEVFDAIFDD